VAAFKDYRRYGTVDYKEGLEWDEYVTSLHGDKELFVKEVLLDEWLEERGLERPYEGEFTLSGKGCPCRRKKVRKMAVFLTWASRGRLVSG